MDELGHTWTRRFAGRPEQAGSVRAWVRTLLVDTDDNAVSDAVLVASELFTAAVLDRDAVTMTVSTAGSRIRVYATSPTPLTVSHTYGPWRPLVEGLATAVGSDEYTVWVDLTAP